MPIARVNKCNFHYEMVGEGQALVFVQSPDDPALLQDVRNFRQAWVTGARRFTMMEYPEQFNAVLDQFLGELGPSQFGHAREATSKTFG